MHMVRRLHFSLKLFVSSYCQRDYRENLVIDLSLVSVKSNKFNTLVFSFVNQMLMEEPVFDNLRTKEQLGYSVFSMMRYTFGVLGFSVSVNTQVDKFRSVIIIIKILIADMITFYINLLHNRP